jgi:hypothetical protein
MAVIAPNTAINRILAALGLENVRSLKINATVNNAVMVVTEQYVTGTQVDDLATALETKEWVLVPRHAGRWIPAEERLPEAEAEVLVAWRLPGGGQQVDSARLFNNGIWVATVGHSIGRVTHWMPLPEPPEVK